jgi:hypothetical protein
MYTDTTPGLGPLVVCLVAALGTGTPLVKAHETAGSGGAGVGLASTVTTVTVVGLIAGVAAAGGRVRLRCVREIIGWTVGPLLVVLGSAALLSAFRGSQAAGLTGLLVGGIAVGVVARRDGHARGEAAVGAVGVHRLVEGVTLAGLVGTGSRIGVVALVVLGGHTVAECVAVGGHSGLDWRRALVAVAGVEVAFVGGAFLGLYWSGLATSLPDLWLSAIVGGLLLCLGGVETDLRGVGG